MFVQHLLLRVEPRGKTETREDADLRVRGKGISRQKKNFLSPFPRVQTVKTAQNRTETLAIQTRESLVL